MAPPKAKARASHAQPPPLPSDYETDAPPPAVDVPLPPPRSNEELNFAVLQRVYPELHAIEHVTPYAALYTFNLETQQWEKVGVEGTLFVCQLTPLPNGVERFCVVIFNRRGLDNFYLDLTSSEEMEIAEPYIILQGDDVVYGIWIFADPPPASTSNCRVETATKMMEIADRAKASREAKENHASNVSNDVVEQVEPASSAPMGRQLSLRELFGQQREQDADFSLHNHHSQPTPHAYPHVYVPNQNSRPPPQDVLSVIKVNCHCGEKPQSVAKAAIAGHEDEQARKFKTTKNVISKQEPKSASPIAFLVYDMFKGIVIWGALWLAFDEKDPENWKGHVALCIAMLLLDTAIKDIWYGKLKKGCKCTCPSAQK